MFNLNSTKSYKLTGNQILIDAHLKCPYKYKYQLVDWLVKCRGWKKSHAKKLTRPQLYAIWYKS